MKVRNAFRGVIGALFLSGAMLAPAMAQTTNIGSVPVEVTVQDDGTALGIGIESSTGFDFGIVQVDADEAATNGVVNAGTATLVLSITGDTKLFNTTGFDITLRLANGYLAPAIQPSFEASSPANFQIPGRYLKISAVGNPLQAKYTGSASCTDPWTGDGIPTDAQCVPRDAAGTAPIYKVGDPVGLFGAPDYGGGPCRVTSGSSPVAWPAACPDASFSTTGSKMVMHFRPGSGTVVTNQTIEMTLDVPAGVYPETYTGSLVIEKVVTI